MMNQSEPPLVARVRLSRAYSEIPVDSGVITRREECVGGRRWFFVSRPPSCRGCHPTSFSQLIINCSKPALSEDNLDTSHTTIVIVLKILSENE